MEQKNYKTERARGLGRKIREETGKGESKDSPEIPDRRETSDIPSLPLGGGGWEVVGGVEGGQHSQPTDFAAYVYKDAFQNEKSVKFFLHIL